MQRYGLGKETVYDSEARQKHLDTAAETGLGRVGLLRGLASAAMAAVTLHVTIDGLIRGQHIEARSLPELIATEEAIREACATVKEYLAVAATFDDREQVVEI